MRYILLLSILLLQLQSFPQNKTGNLSANIPTVSQVGATNLPDKIAPVNALFPMPQFQKPVFPKLAVSITQKGAKQNILSTNAIQAAIDEVNSRGGGMVIIPAGIWKTGRISLKSNVNLHISEGAELHFSPDVEDYRPAVFTRNEGIEVMSLGALIYANNQENIALTGKGILIGPGEGSVRKQTMTTKVIEEFVPLDKPVSERIFEGKNGEDILPPMFISPINCRKVYIEGVTLRNTAFWNIVPVYCDNVIIRGVTVQSVGIPRGDGIDIESSKNVLIEYSTLSSGDDCFTIKAGRGEDGMRVNKPSENIVIRYCLAREGHGGITVGSETAAMIRNLYVHDCVFDDTNVGIRFKTRRPRGGGGENLTYERIRMNLRGEAFKFDMLGSRTHVGELADRLPVREINRLTPHFSNIMARNIIVEKAKTFVDIQGIPESPVDNMLIENANITTKNLFIASDAKNVSIKNSRINASVPAISLLDGKNITFEKVTFNEGDKAVSVKVEGEGSQNIRFINCLPEKPEGWEKSTWSK